MSNSADNTAESEASPDSGGDEVLDLTEEVPSDAAEEAADNEDLAEGEGAVDAPGGEGVEEAGLRETIQTTQEELEQAEQGESAEEIPSATIVTPQEPVDPPEIDEEPIEPPVVDEPVDPEALDDVPDGADTIQEDALKPEDREQGPVRVTEDETDEEEGDGEEGGNAGPADTVVESDDEPIEPEPVDEADLAEESDADEGSPEDAAASKEGDGEMVPPEAAYETVQMEAIDRTTLEREGQIQQLEQTLPLLSSRFAPEIVVAAPRELIEEWRTGPPPTPPDAEPEQLDPGEMAEDTNPSGPPETPADSGAQTPPQPSPPDQMQGETPTRPPSALDDPQGAPRGSARSTTPQSAPAQKPEAIEEPPADAPPTDGPPAGPPPEVDEGPGEAPPPEEEKDEELSEIVDELVEGEKEEQEETVPTKQAEPSSDWIQQVFGELYLATVPESIERRTEREADFIVESLGLSEDDNVLDLACGFGRHTIDLVERGYDVVGFDLSKPLLKQALQEAKNRSLKINFFHGDMRNLDFDGVFDACFCWQTSFGYFEDKTNLDILARVNRALRPEGTILFDVMNRDYVIRKMPHRIWWEGQDCIFLEEGEFDFDSSTLHMNRSFIYEDGRPPIEQDWYIRLYSPHEFRQMLSKAGFQVTELSGAIHYRGDFIGRDSPKLIARAEKVQSLG